jgi:uncharacterized protein
LNAVATGSIARVFKKIGGRCGRRSKCRIGAAIVGIGLLAWAGLVEPRRMVVRRARLRLPRWPARLTRLRVAVVSDLHAGGPHVGDRRLERVVARVNREAPDLVVLLGDYVDPDLPAVPPLPAVRPLPPERVATALERLRAPLGVVAVLGNHDWSNDGEQVAAALRAVGARVLENEALELVARGGPLWILGVADLRKRHPDLDAAMRAVPEDSPLLVLTHDPDVFPEVPARAALTLAGHTHGGQIDVPWLRRLMIPSLFGARYAAGHIEEGGRHLYVSQGVGTTGLPLRRQRLPAGGHCNGSCAGGGSGGDWGMGPPGRAVSVDSYLLGLPN